jgi:hypothetical protein
MLTSELFVCFLVSALFSYELLVWFIFVISLLFGIDYLYRTILIFGLRTEEAKGIYMVGLSCK